jgi:hypothetical protein
MDDKQEIKTKRNLYSRAIELYIWVIVAMLTILPAIFYSVREGGFRPEFFLNFYNQFLFAVFIVLIPLLFNLIFGQFPIEYVRNKRNFSQGIKIENSNNINVVIENDEKLLSELTYVENCINESKNIAERVFSRSGVYLLVGCLVAFTGVAIFYSPLFSITPSTDVTQRLLDYLPRFGALFFIEFIAFFFLKQYRIMLEEYRYYEAIKRKRQDNFALVELIEKHKDNPELLNILVNKVTQSTIAKLANGETTEVLETQKIVNQDMDIFSKFTDLIKEIKSK